MKYYYAKLKVTESVAEKIGTFVRLRKLTKVIPEQNQSLMLRIKHILSYNVNINDFDIYEIECDNKFNFISFNKIDNSVIKKLAMLL